LAGYELNELTDILEWVYLLQTDIGKVLSAATAAFRTLETLCGDPHLAKVSVKGNGLKLYSLIYLNITKTGTTIGEFLMKREKLNTGWSVLFHCRIDTVSSFGQYDDCRGE
jgi:hypothetical protein